MLCAVFNFYSVL